MNYIDFKNNLENGKEFSIYLFVGEDAFKSKNGIKLIEQKFISEPTVNLAKFDGEEADFKEVFSSFLSLPFLSRKRMTVVSEFYPLKEQLNELKGYSQGVSDGILVIVNQDTKKSEAIKKIGNICLIECDKDEPYQVSLNIKAICENSSISIDRETAKYIADACLSDMTRAESETNKLISYCYDKKVISLEDAKLMVAVDTDFKIYEMTDCLAKRDIDGALKIIDDLLRKDDNPIGIISATYKHFRRLLHSTISGLTNSELASYFGVKEFAVEKMKVQAKKFSPKSLKKAIDLLTEADVKCKNGESNPNGITWTTIFNIMVG